MLQVYEPVQEGSYIKMIDMVSGQGGQIQVSYSYCYSVIVVFLVIIAVIIIIATITIVHLLFWIVFSAYILKADLYLLEGCQMLSFVPFGIRYLQKLPSIRCAHQLDLVIMIDGHRSIFDLHFYLAK